MAPGQSGPTSDGGARVEEATGPYSTGGFGRSGPARQLSAHSSPLGSANALLGLVTPLARAAPAAGRCAAGSPRTAPAAPLLRRAGRPCSARGAPPWRSCSAASTHSDARRFKNVRMLVAKSDRVAAAARVPRFSLRHWAGSGRLRAMGQASQSEAIAREMPAPDRRGEFANSIRSFLRRSERVVCQRRATEEPHGGVLREMHTRSWPSAPDGRQRRAEWAS